MNDQAWLKNASGAPRGDDDNADADDDKANQYMGEKDRNGVVPWRGIIGQCK